MAAIKYSNTKQISEKPLQYSNTTFLFYVKNFCFAIYVSQEMLQLTAEFTYLQSKHRSDLK